MEKYSCQVNIFVTAALHLLDISIVYRHTYMYNVKNLL